MALTTSIALARKVPRIIALFWLVKILTTAFGESASDYLVHVLDPMVAVAIGTIAFVLALALQFRVRRYISGVYWLTVAMVAVFGTMAADVAHVGLGIPYAVSTSVFAVVLAIVFTAWRASEKTLSIHSITTRRREVYYWCAVLSTFALGTAAGDLAAVSLNLGYLGAGLVFAAAICIPALAYWKLGLNEVAAFWAAYVLTRPLGASFADWFGKPITSGGLGLGDGTVSLILATIIVLLVGYLQISRVDVERPAG